MEPILYLVHRIPFPPNKGDKIRSYHLLKALAGRYRVHLGCFVDDPADQVHVGALEDLCAGVCAVPLHPRLAKIRSLSGLLNGAALTVPYYRDRRMDRWTRATIAREGIRRAVVFSSPMAQYVAGLPHLHTVLDLVDVDSAKWAAYAAERPWPLSALYAREGRRLLAFERAAAARAAATTLVTQAEARLFKRLAPECAGAVSVVENGVDSAFFSPRPERKSPFAVDEAAVVFTGVMDYYPNVDAVTWFAREVLPAIRKVRPDVRFYAVGMNPTPAVRALAADPGVVVTGSVDDVRPFLQHAAAIVAPLRIARGVQNKVLEAMAMGRPVVVSTPAAEGIAARPGVEFATAGDANEFARRTLQVLEPLRGTAMGAAARARIASAYAWERSAAQLHALLETRPDAEPRHAPPARGLQLAGQR